MPQTVWKGALTFGLVNVPVSLVATTRSTRVSFRQLHAKDKAPIRIERKCTVDGETVESSELVRGAEVEKDTYVVITDEELEAVEPESSRSVRIEEFVRAGDVDPVYVDRSYALAPQPGGERAYVLLHDALARRGEVAIGRLTMRSREHLVSIRAGDRLLFVDVLHYPDEVRDLGEVESRVAREGDVSDEEKELVDVLLERLHREWNPDKYEDRYSEAVRELVAAKARGESVTVPRPEKPRATTDLLAALRQTLEMEEEKRGEKSAEAA